MRKISRVINRAEVKRNALRVSREFRAGKFTRVSAQFIDLVEDNTRRFIYSQIMAQPSMGKTIK
jgi:hypothetical protein